ncbi:NADH-quinone oxidoreductase subunit NuoB [bacterium]|nr:NADH-quinone oxidoreductase subunit NuoB [bacterium]
MLQIIRTRLKQGHRTIPFPAKPPELPKAFRGRPMIDQTKCRQECHSCTDACPTDAIGVNTEGVGVDLGRCLFCGECENVCPHGAIHSTQNYILSTRTKDALIIKDERFEVAENLKDKTRQIFGRSLKLRQVSAGGCGACEADTNALNTIVFDLGRFGIQFVASPRHADGLLITGPVTQNMKLALEKTYTAVPSPKIVIAVGACAISGGIYLNHPEAHNGADSLLPVDLYIPGCPPHPLTILDGLLRLLGRIF